METNEHLDDDSAAVEAEESAAHPGEFEVVGIGIPSDGTERLRAFFAALPDRPGMAFVVVPRPVMGERLNPDRLEVEAAGLSVERADDGTVVRPNRVYIVGPNDEFGIQDGRLRAESTPERQSKQHPIDDFLISVAREHRGRSIGLAFAGLESIGTDGLRAIRDAGGTTIVQSPEDSETESTRREALDDEAGLVAGVDDVVRRLVESTRPRTPAGTSNVDANDLTDRQSDAFDGILSKLQSVTGTDFTRYRRSTLLRRLDRRMQIARVDELPAYARMLDEDDGETRALFDGLLDPTTSFFRDPEVWQRFREDVLPELFDYRRDDDQIRIWVPGCATGEEAYTISMLLTDFAKDLEHAPDVKIFATDIDADAIRYARRGRFTRRSVEQIPPEFVGRYLQVRRDAFAIAPEVRKKVLFGVQNVFADPPFAKLDAVSCRNLLCDLDAPARSELLRLLRYGLRSPGFLLVGADESTTETTSLYDEVLDVQGLYRARSSVEADVAVPTEPFGFDALDFAREDEDDETSMDAASLHRIAILESHAPPSVLVDADFELLHTEGDLDPYLSVSEGEPTGELLPTVKDRLRAPVRDLLEDVLLSRSEGSARRVPGSDGDGGAVRLEAHPFEPDELDRPVAELSFHRSVSHGGFLVDQSDESSGDTRRSDERIRELEDELERTRNRLESTARDYESANEGLRASNRELVSLNEQLQSTSEELATARAEVRATNEELSRVNAELEDKVRELESVNFDLENLLRSTDIGAIFLNGDLEVERFTDGVEQYFHIDDGDLGRPIDHISTSLQTEDFVADARRVLDGRGPVERRLSSVDGDRHLAMRAVPYLTDEESLDGVVLTFVDVTERRDMQELLAMSELKFRTLFEHTGSPIFVHDCDADGRPGQLLEANEKMKSAIGLDDEQLLARSVDELLGGPDFDRKAYRENLVRHGKAEGLVRLDTPTGEEVSPRRYSAHRIPLGETPVVIVVLDEPSAERGRESRLVESRERAEELAELRGTVLQTLSHDIRSPLTAISAITELLSRTVDDDEAREVERIEELIEQSSELLDSMLRTAHVETNQVVPEPVRFDIVEHVRELVSLHRARARSNDLYLEYEGAKAPVVVRLDPELIARIINNLVENAVKYTPEGGITVRCTRTVDDRVRVDVVDTGVGMSQDEQALLFERPDASGPQDDRGSVGLGLAITKLLVESMRGTVSVSSNPQVGTRFTVELPRELPDQPRE